MSDETRTEFQLGYKAAMDGKPRKANASDEWLRGYDHEIPPLAPDPYDDPTDQERR